MANPTGGDWVRDQWLEDKCEACGERLLHTGECRNPNCDINLSEQECDGDDISDADMEWWRKEVAREEGMLGGIESYNDWSET